MQVRRRTGFTLVEMLVALTIGSLLVVATVSATRAMTTTRESVDRRTERVAEARRAMEAIVAGLRNVRRDPIADKPLIVGNSGGRGAGNDSINFLAISDRRVRPDGPESDQYEMSFFLSTQNGQGVPRLVCRRDHAFDDHPEEGGIATIVAEGIASLSFEYFSNGDWYPEWRASEPRPPQAIRITLVAVTPPPPGSQQGTDATVLSSMVPIRVNPPEQPPQSRNDRNPGEPPGEGMKMNMEGPPG